ncbi:cellulase family glycosylhydrolase [Tomitella gaofuii]|uniref:endoglycoceramidase I n=1 Tax=Tomitella gaofuii TaxID=2760083 RepID=UPI0015F9B18C|nr:cellulase family glycosylhydrolase [Tomitella gaofuii]
MGVHRSSTARAPRGGASRARRTVRALTTLWVTVAVGFGAALIAPATAAAAEPAQSISPPTGPLHTDGTRIVDEYGRTVLVHGVNNVDKGGDGESRARELVVSGDGFTITPRDAELLAGYGFNAVRLGVSFAGLMPERGRIDHAYIGRVVGMVDMLAAHGIRTLLDNHQDGLSPVWGGNGFPPWSIAARPLPGEPNPGFPLYYLMPSMNAGWDEVWNNDNGVLDRLGEALGALAGAVRGHDGAMGIELLNEPWPGTAAPTCFPVGCPGFDSRYQSALESLTADVRAQNPDIPVYWEPNVTWNQLMPSKLGAARPITDAGIVFAPHDYCIPSQTSIYLSDSGGSADLTGLCPVQQDHTWANIDAFAARTRLPTVVTEFGDGDPAVLGNTLRNADERFAGWFYWHYSSTRGAGYTEPDPFAAPGPPGQASVGRHLVRTYPQATAGMPLSMDFDIESGAFRYTYEPGARAQEPGPAGETLIYVSSLHYPDGYVAEVDGGSVTSTPGARYLTVRAAGSGPVTVRVHGR